MSHNGKRLLSRVDVSEIYGIGVRFLATAASRGDGPPLVRVGRLVRYRQDDIESWLDRNAENLAEAQ